MDGTALPLQPVVAWSRQRGGDRRRMLLALASRWQRLDQEHQRLTSRAPVAVASRTEVSILEVSGAKGPNAKGAWVQHIVLWVVGTYDVVRYHSNVHNPHLFPLWRPDVTVGCTSPI
jgi:hypothetical protein